MIEIKAQRNGKLDLFISVTGPAVYLDNFAIKELAKGDASRRRRFLAAVNRGAELLFSVANAAELTGFQDGSFTEVRAFLEEIGPHWFPVTAVQISRSRVAEVVEMGAFSGFG